MRRLALFALAAAGLLFLVATVVFGGYSDELVRSISTRVQEAIREQVVWRPDSPPRIYARFQNDTNPDAPPIFIRFYFFNITNVDDVRQGAKPVLQELGPYTFLKHRQKRNISFSPDGSRVSFQEYTFHLPHPGHHHEGAAAGAPQPAMDDRITTLNLPLAGAMEAIIAYSPQKAQFFLELLVNVIARWKDPRVHGLFTTRTAEELLWGYQDPLLAEVAEWLPAGRVDPTARLVLNMTAPEEADTFPPNTVNTGAADLSRVWDYERWQGVPEVTSWAQGHRERVRGSDAFQFRPGLVLNDSLLVWVGELYRAAKLLAKEEVQLGGVPLLRLRPDPAQGDPDPRFNQEVQGLMNVTGPHSVGPTGQPGSKPGPPLFLSYPHFCGADPALAEGVVGVTCDPEKHAMFVDVEPTTGITLRAAKRLQLSSWFGQRWRALDPDVADTFLPVFWAQESSQAQPYQLASFAPLLRAKGLVAFLQAWSTPLAAASAVLGILCVLALSLLAVPATAEGPEEEQEQQDSCSVAGGVAIAVGGADEPAVTQRLLPRVGAPSRQQQQQQQRQQQWQRQGLEEPLLQRGEEEEQLHQQAGQAAGAAGSSGLHEPAASAVSAPGRQGCHVS